ncbi:MAG: hypothetical protein NVS3B5_00580 [Sphingomicrobium sp.]
MTVNLIHQAASVVATFFFAPKQFGIRWLALTHLSCCHFARFCIGAYLPSGWGPASYW